MYVCLYVRYICTYVRIYLPIYLSIMNTLDSNTNCSTFTFLKCQFLGTFGDLSKFRGGIDFLEKKAPDLPPPEDCLSASTILRKSHGGTFTIHRNIELRVPKDSPFAQGALQGKSGQTRPILEGWLAFNDGRAPCLHSLAFFCDANPPPILNLFPAGWVPTVEYTVHFWNHPPRSYGGDDTLKWVRMRCYTCIAKNGLVSEEAEAWSEDGSTLLATSRQLARILTPKKSGS